jgi:hypothetical protein
MGSRRLRFAAVVLAGAASVAVAATATAAGPRSDLSSLRHATASYHDLNVAVAAGYGKFTDAKGIACIDMPGMGAMGNHYVLGSLVGDGAVNLTTPEALVYAPDEDGHLNLAAVEYVVFKADWDAKHTAPPTLFGQAFNETGAVNRYGLPPYYSLHVWVWQHNPAGMFAMWNPNVSCSLGHDSMDDMPSMSH